MAWVLIADSEGEDNKFPVRKLRPECSEILTERARCVEPTYPDAHCAQPNSNDSGTHSLRKFTFKNKKLRNPKIVN